MNRNSTLVSDVMSRPVITIGPDARVSEVLALAERRGVHHFPIVDGGGPIGLVCTCDFGDAPPESKVWKFARSPPVTVGWHSPARKAARLMNQYAIGSVVVVNGKGLCGIVTRQDLASNESLAHLVEGSRCSACGANTHLRPCPDGAFLCVECIERTRSSNWFDFGVAD